MNDEKPDRRLADLAQDYNKPPPTPRERMWERIDAARAERRDPDAGKVVRLPWWHSRKVLWPAAAVAALIVGIAVGRFMVPGGGGGGGMPGSAPGPLAEVSTEAEAEAEVAQAIPEKRGMLPPAKERWASRDVYRFAAVPVLSKAQLLLTQYRTGEAEAANGDGFSGRAAHLLAETRLLMDSPAAEDRELDYLLRDLELVLAQIVRVTAEREDDERQWIEENVDQRALLDRLRTQIPAAESGLRF